MKKLILLLLLTSVASYSQNNSANYKKNYDNAVSNLINNDLENALKNINIAITLNPNQANAFYIRGNIYQKKGKLTFALEDYLKAIKLSPNHEDAILKTVIIYGKLQDFENSCKYLKRACDLGNNDGCNGYKKFCN